MMWDDKVPRDEMKWGEGCRHWSVALGYDWPLTVRRSIMSISWLQVTETLESETMDKGGLLFVIIYRYIYIIYMYVCLYVYAFYIYKLYNMYNI